MLGLVAGPFLSNGLGWQVTSEVARAQARARIVEQQAAYCNVLARADVAGREIQLDWRMRNDLASKWSTMPGNTQRLEFDVVSACAQMLARG